MLAEGTFDEVMANAAVRARLPGPDGRRVSTATATAPDRSEPGGADVLSVRHVSAAYGPYRALFDVSFRVPDGGVVALVGSNGAGKSTVARTVTGLVTASSGEVVFCGQDVTQLPAYKIARLGMAHVVEGRGVFSSLTVEENLTLAFRQRDGRGQAQGQPRARLHGVSRSSGSGGARWAARSRAASSACSRWPRSWSCPPKVLVADELSLGLAPVVVDAVYEGLKEINRNGTALVVVEQQVDRVLELATWAVVLTTAPWPTRGTRPVPARRSTRSMARREEAAASGAAEADEAEGIAPGRHGERGGRARTVGSDDPVGGQEEART